MKSSSTPRAKTLWLVCTLAIASCKPIAIAAEDRNEGGADADAPAQTCIESVVRLSAEIGAPTIFVTCLPHALGTSLSHGARVARASVRIKLPQGADCSSVPGAIPVLDDFGRPVQQAWDIGGASGLGNICTFAQVPTDINSAPITSGDGINGFYYDTSIDPNAPYCIPRISFTAATVLPTGTVVNVLGNESMSLPGCQDDGGVAWTASSAAPTFGQHCDEPHPPLVPQQPSCAPDAGCFYGGETVIEQGSALCNGLACVVNHWDEAARPEEGDVREICTCRCADEHGIPDPQCTCPTGYRCDALAGEANSARLRGSYCVPATLPPAPAGGP